MGSEVGGKWGDSGVWGGNGKGRGWEGGGGGEVAGRWWGVVRGEGGDWGRWEIRSWWREKAVFLASSYNTT